jgi:hypothetical protein
MSIFSFQAQSEEDVVKFEVISSQLNIAMSVARTPPEAEGLAVGVEIETHADIATVRAIMRNIPDGKHMIQTLREFPLNENSLELDPEAR